MKTHQMSGTKFYKTWKNIKKRCDPTKKDTYIYRRYAGRGIKVCPEWAESFEKFFNDMIKSYVRHIEEYGVSNTTIERKDVNGDYTPENTVWATWEEQRKNTTACWRITFNGETKTMSDWSKDTGIPMKTLHNRLKNLGWSVEEALTLESDPRKREDR